MYKPALKSNPKSKSQAKTTHRKEPIMAKAANQQPKHPKHIEELEDIRNTLGRIGHALLADADPDNADTTFDQGSFDQVAIAFHAIASIVGYPIPETE